MSVPGGESSSTAVLDAAPESSSALPVADAPVESTGDVEGVESQPSEENAEPTTTPDSDDESAEDVEDPADEGKTDEEKKLSRRERQKLREQERIDKAVAARVAADRAADAAAAAQKAAADKAAATHQARLDRLSKFTGTPDTLTGLQREIASIQDQIDSELTTPQGLDLDALLAQKREKQATHARLSENGAMAGEIENFVWDQIENAFFSAARFPEFADDAARQRYMTAPGGVEGALQVLAHTIRTAKDAEWQAKFDTERKESKAKIDAMTSDRNAWRARAGGAEDAPMQGGVGGSSNGVLTPAVYAAMSFEDRMKLRSTPEGRRRIDAMTR